MLFCWAISNSTTPQPRHLFCLQPSASMKKKCFGFRAMLLDIALQNNIYTLQILFLTDVEKLCFLRGLSFLSYLFELSISPEPF